MEKHEALNMIADGHAVYSADGGRECLEALGVPWKESYARPMHSDPPSTFKGLTMREGSEGERCVSALSLGRIACQHYGLTPMAAHGRGTQGRLNAEALRRHFADAAAADEESL